MAVKWIPGEGGYSYAPEAAKKQYVREKFKTKSPAGGGSGSSVGSSGGSSKQSNLQNVTPSASNTKAVEQMQRQAQQQAAAQQQAQQQQVQAAAQARAQAQSQQKNFVTKTLVDPVKRTANLAWRRVDPTPEPQQRARKEARKQGIAEFKMGVAKQLVGLGKGGIKLASYLGTQKLTASGQPATKEPALKLPGPIKAEIERIETAPETPLTIAGRGAVLAPIVVSAGSGFVAGTRASGVGTATQDLIASAGPLQIRAGTYGALSSQSAANEIKTKVVGLQAKRGDVTTTVLKGRTSPTQRPATLKATQVSKTTGKGTAGVSRQEIRAPITRLKSGRVEQGVRVIKQETVFAGRAGKADLVSTGKGLRLSQPRIKGSAATGKTRVVSQTDFWNTGFSSRITPTTPTRPVEVGGISTSKKGIITFQAGSANRVMNIARTGNIRTRGIILDVSKAVRPAKGGVRIGSGKSSSPKTITTQPGSSVITAPPSVTTTPTGTTVRIIPATGKSSQLNAAPKLDTPQKTKSSPEAQVQQPKVVQTSEPRVDITTPRISSGRGRTGQTQQQKPAQKTQPKVITTPTTSSGTRQDTKQKQVPKLSLKQIQRMGGPIVPIIPSPRVIEEPPRTPIGLPRIRSTPKPRASKQFGVQLRRFGEWRTVGTGLTKSQAITRGIRAAGSTLGASIRFTGPTKITKLPGFRQSKKDPTVLVEPRKRRLSTRGEIKEIKLAKLK